MHPKISLTERSQEISNLVVVVSGVKALPEDVFTSEEIKYIKHQNRDLKKHLITLDRLGNLVFVYLIKEENSEYERLEECRKNGCRAANQLNRQKATQCVVFDQDGHPGETLAFTEGMALGSYRFLKYKEDREDENTLKRIEIYSEELLKIKSEIARSEKRNYKSMTSEISLPRYLATSLPEHMNVLTDAVFLCRDLINEPGSVLTATAFARQVQKLGKECGAMVEVMNKKKIEALKMGGLLGVNQGSDQLPTFTVMEWNPEKAVNKHPVVFVGKGIVFDSGGMNLKPGDSMLNMKDDMSGAAAVALAVYAIAKAKLPVHVVALMPATDNRPGPNAIVPGDILRMHNGMTVEVINTDAEGRLILADALSYAQKYKPSLVIDMATLTGAAVRAIGKFACAGMQSRAAEEFLELQDCGFRVCERIVELPLWSDYADLVKSSVADIKNLGPGEAGTITAGKFLEKFTKYPYIHLDIAGPAFLEKRDSYRGLGGTGFGVRLLYEYVKRIGTKD